MKNIEIKGKSRQEIIDEVKKVVRDDGGIGKLTFIRLMIEDPSIVMYAVPSVKYPSAVLEGMLFPKGIFNQDVWDKMYASVQEDENDTLLANIINSAEDIVNFTTMLEYISVDTEKEQYDLIYKQLKELIPMSYMKAIDEEIAIRDKEDTVEETEVA